MIIPSLQRRKPRHSKDGNLPRTLNWKQRDYIDCHKSEVRGGSLKAIESWIVRSGKGLRGRLGSLFHFIDEKIEAQRETQFTLRIHSTLVTGMPDASQANCSMLFLERSQEQ